ncbi:Tex-like protein N-terminal domain protein [Leptotrichia hofstadii F0254]|uniref:Tex-like protein N-terminal domain protein n=1 Tax=Leptotrichia hofstadii F0254 TaxID=634994 RepID=C9N0V0_9FUSO|nr:Tex-like protein N-terminal domain protein [Leptotrichia hofstadii F0254]
MDIVASVAKELNFKVPQVENTIKLFDEGATVPFIARYRKEVTGNMDEEQIRDVIEKITYYRNLEKRKEEVIRLIEEQGKLTEELHKSIVNAMKLQEVEDLYLPYKKKKKQKRILQKSKDWSLFQNLHWQKELRWSSWKKKLRNMLRKKWRMLGLQLKEFT